MAPSPSSASGELWGEHVMPFEVQVDCLLPTGIITTISCYRDMKISAIKEMLFKDTTIYPLKRLVGNCHDYVLVTVTLNGLREELYDESRRLCDLHLFWPLFKLVEPVGNRHEKELCRKFDDCKDLELVQARINFLQTCDDAVAVRKTKYLDKDIDLYSFPSDLVSLDSEEVPARIANENVIVCVWMGCAISLDPGGSQKVSLRVNLSWTPNDVIKLAITQRSRKFSGTRLRQEDTHSAEAQLYTLKVAGCSSYFFEEVPLYRYQYIRQCIAQHEKTAPQLMLMSKEAEFSKDTLLWDLQQPTFVKRKTSVLANKVDTDPLTLWELDSMFKLRINSASYVNITDSDTVYVKVGIYHGPEQIDVRDTDTVPATNPRWNQVLEFNLYIPDIPRAAQICFSLWSIKLRKNKKEHCALAWANLRLIDFTGAFLDAKTFLHMWNFPKGFEGTLHPLGVNGSNPNRDSVRLEIEFECFGRSVVYPPKSQIDDYYKKVIKVWMIRQNPEKAPTDPKKITKQDQFVFTTICKRDPLHEMTEQEKETLWKLREYCALEPNCLPRLLDAVTWSSREQVAEVYVLLSRWKPVHPETALELLDIKYPDSAVRDFAVSCLDEGLSDNQLSLFLLPLVQVLKYEPFIDNSLSKWLLKRALLNQRIGHWFFWLIRAELSHNASWIRFALLLEAFCRGCGPYLDSLLKQTEAICKLQILSTLVKDKREDAPKILVEELEHNLDVLQNIESPLDCSHYLGSLQLEECRVLSSARRPIWLVWKNPDPLADLSSSTHEVIFKSGDDLRQDMLTLQVLRIMDSIWKAEDQDFQIIPYKCLPMGKCIGMIEVVRNSKTIFEMQRENIGRVGSLNIGSVFLNKWIRDHNKSEEKYKRAVDRFTRSCAGYCVATFVLGIRDRHQDNIMVTEDGRIFHIDFGHFLGHYKRKFGINRERVPFVLTDLFLTVIARGADNPKKSSYFNEFQKLCDDAYLILHRHSRLFITLFTMMLCMGIPELQTLEDIVYLRKTLGADLSEEEALDYFHEKMNEAYEGGWTTKTNWFFHGVRHM